MAGQEDIKLTTMTFTASKMYKMLCDRFRQSQPSAFIAKRDGGDHVVR